jgi:hypothetical protein
MASPNPVTAEENSSPTEEADSETLLEAFTKAVSGNPRFQEAKKSGRAYVIGAKPSAKTP